MLRLSKRGSRFTVAGLHSSLKKGLRCLLSPTTVSIVLYYKWKAEEEAEKIHLSCSRCLTMALPLPFSSLLASATTMRTSNRAFFCS